MGGLFEGFPAAEIQRRGVIAWDPPWDIRGWEVSEGFWRKWRWTFEGCGDVLEATNSWRRGRGESAIVDEVGGAEVWDGRLGSSDGPVSLADVAVEMQPATRFG